MHYDESVSEKEPISADEGATKRALLRFSMINKVDDNS
jgi:hypothetical protein